MREDSEMAVNRQKIKLIKLYELLRKETDEDHPSPLAGCRFFEYG